MRYKFEDIAINSTAKKKPAPADKDVYLGLEHLDSGSLTVTRFGSEVAPIGEKLLMKKGDVLFGKRRAYQKKVAVAPFDGIFSAHGMVLRPKETVVDSSFFPLLISSDYFLDAAIKISVGSLSPTINWRDLRELAFDLPTLKEQRRLAAILWANLETRTAYRELLALTKQLEKSRFVEMFGSEQIKRNDWEQVPAIEVFHKPMSGEWGADDTDGTGVKVLRTTNFTDEGYIDYSSVVTRKVSKEKCLAKKLRINDIIIEKSGGSDTKPVGRVVFVRTELDNYLFNNFTSVLRLLDSKKFDIWFIFHFLFNTYWNGGTKQYDNKTTGIHNLRLSEYLENTYIPCPPLELQNQFADFVRQADKSKFELQRTIDELEATYKSLIRENVG
jgi:type I restriction enzyme S subunit